MKQVCILVDINSLIIYLPKRGTEVIRILLRARHKSLINENVTTSMRQGSRFCVGI